MLLAAAGLGLLLVGPVQGRVSGRAAQPREAFIADREVIPYCNLPAGARATIPPLEAPSDIPGLHLLQVQVVARHGSRTPHTLYNPTCWAGYGFRWDCNMTELIDPAPSSTPVGPNGTWVPWLYRKVYDGSPTVLGGTCHLGQLVKDGFLQEYANGEMLHDAYIGLGDLKLFDTDRLDEIPLDHVYLRADDDPSQRTEMSGMLLVKGMFQGSKKKHIVTVPFHTGDFSLDDIYPNYKVEAAAFASDEYAELNGTSQVADLDRRMASALPGYNWGPMLDCLMTTACTGRPFPPSFDQATFEEAAEHAVWQSSFPFHWNNSHFSKLAMGPFAYTLLQNMEQRAEGQSRLKFAMFLGHDTTLLPLLCAWGVWDGQWPAYASIITLELYGSSAGEHYFRMVYSGKELVLPGCKTSLCPLSKLREASTWASAEFADACFPAASKEGAANDRPGGAKVAESVGIAAGAVAVVLVLAMVVGMLLGTVATISWSRRFAASEGETTQLGVFRSLPLQDIDAI